MRNRASITHPSRHFLLLGIGFSLNHIGFQEDEKPRNPPIAVSTISSLHAEIRPILLLNNVKTRRRDIWYSSEYGRLALVLGNRNSASADARRIAEGLQALISLRQGWPLSQAIQPYGIPRSLIKKEVVLRSDLDAFEQHADQYSGALSMSISERLDNRVIFSEAAMAYAFFYLPHLMAEKQLFEAVHFYQECVSDFVFEGDSITGVLREPESQPETERDRVQLESALLSAFRAIEALIGEPGSNEERFKARLAGVGINPEEPVGFRDGERKPIHGRIRFVHDLRDTTAAHGRRRRSTPLRFIEVMEAQHLAQNVVVQALFHIASDRGRKHGTDAERRYLLEAMFGPRRLRQLQKQIGKRPEVLVKDPRGLATISDAIEKA